MRRRGGQGGCAPGEEAGSMSALRHGMHINARCDGHVWGVRLFIRQYGPYTL